MKIKFASSSISAESYVQDHCKLLENQGYRRDIIERKLVLFEFCVLRCIYLQSFKIFCLIILRYT